MGAGCIGSGFIYDVRVITVSFAGSRCKDYDYDTDYFVSNTLSGEELGGTYVNIKGPNILSDEGNYAMTLSSQAGKWSNTLSGQGYSYTLSSTGTLAYILVSQLNIAI